MINSRVDVNVPNFRLLASEAHMLSLSRSLPLLVPLEKSKCFLEKNVRSDLICSLDLNQFVNPLHFIQEKDLTVLLWSRLQSNWFESGSGWLKSGISDLSMIQGTVLILTKCSNDQKRKQPCKHLKWLWGSGGIIKWEHSPEFKDEYPCVFIQIQI